jgi:hypothetical protein
MAKFTPSPVNKEPLDERGSVRMRESYDAHKVIQAFSSDF